MSILLQELAQLFKAEVHGNSQILISSVASLEDANPNQISFISNRKYLSKLEFTNAGAIIMSEQELSYCKTNFPHKNFSAIVNNNPYATFARISQYFFDKTNNIDIHGKNIHKNINICESVELPENIKIDAFVTIETGAIFGNNVSIGSGCYIGKNVVVGDNTFIYPNVSIYNDCVIGKNNIIHSGTVIGSDGFGFAPDLHNSNPEWVKIPQIGIVEISDNVEIGSNTTIDRATFGKTLIGKGCKIDNQVQIAHNVSLGNYCVVAGCTAIAGSTKVGNFCMIGGSSQIAGHLEIADGTIISGGTGVMHSTNKGERITGVFPAMQHRDWEKSAAIIRQIQNLRKQIKDIEKGLNKLI
ncbi:MAG: hypothetical protein RLZZ210_1429 [Pseudomonadota bacterium]|jgi:UDP-3-O-[3-hydroxymyristoyl] glucosamine N-acyltransferase